MSDPPDLSTRSAAIRITDLAAPFARGWQRRVQVELDAVPHPADQARQYAPGPDPDRVLVLGNGAAIGFGVRAQHLALPGRLALSLGRRTGRGAIVDVLAQRGITVATVDRLLERTRIERYDAVVVTLGASDAYGLLPTARWAESLEALLDRLLAATSPSTEFMLVAARPLQRPDAAEGEAGRVVDAQAARFDALTEQLCSTRDRTSFLPAPPAPSRPPRTVDDYAALAERITVALAPRLDALAAAPLPGSARSRRAGADDEPLRQQALERSGLLHSRSDDRLARLVDSARELFDAPAAAVTLIDGERVVVKAGDGLQHDEFPRWATPCDRTIRDARVLVIPDLAGEPAGGLGWRFYAGQALESPDGYRIGSFCIFDDRLRPGIDEHAFSELAVLVQSALWAEIERTAEVASTR